MASQGEGAAGSDWQVVHKMQQPQQRRSPSLPEKLAALWYNLSFGGGVASLVLCMYICTFVPILWLALGAYTWWTLRGGGMRAARTGSYPAPLRNWGLWRKTASYFPARLHKTADLAPGKPYIFCVHPHGILSFSAWLAFATEALGFAKLFPGIEMRVLTLSINFKAPIFREYLLLHGVCDVSKRACLTLLGAGKSVMIAGGGGTEALFARPGTNDLVLNRRKGFVKIALRTGASLVPVYAFGENNSYRTVNELPASSPLRRFQRGMTRFAGFTLPLYLGVGILLPVGLLPYPVPLDVVVGQPVEVEKFEGDESSAEFSALVDRYHARYVAALKELFEQHKDKFAKGEADLRIVE